jgi:hypothetical protein
MVARGPVTAARAPNGRRWRGLLLLLGLAVATGLTLLAWAAVIEPARLVTNRVTVALPGWPPAQAGLTIAAISDLHVGAPHVDEAQIRRLIARVNDATPDLVVLLGDYVIHGVIGGRFVAPEILADALEGLRPRLGSFAVLGNHDWWYDGPRVIRALSGAGIQVLDNQAAPIQRGGRTLWLLGLADLWMRVPRVDRLVRQVPDGDPAIVLTHNPDIFPRIPARVVLTLAGHTHGGQVSLPLVGRPVVPSRFGQRYAIGLIEEEGRRIFVTPGIGTSYVPVRFRVPAEISLLTLVPA